MWLILLVGLTLLIAGPASADPVWLVIGASSRSPALIAERARALASSSPSGLVVNTKDCGDTSNILVWATDIAPSWKAAQAALPRAREHTKDAYVKRCHVKPNTLLALMMTAIDPSIADVPKGVVNWSDADRVSSAQSLPDGRTLVIARYFVNEREDPLEGRRERVILATSVDKRVVLTENCVNAGHAVGHKGRIALHCATEQAGDHLLHSVLAFDDAGKALKEIPRCRNPKWLSDVAIVCEEERIGADGRLKLTPQKVEVAATSPG